jgi:hypothetical protein
MTVKVTVQAETWWVREPDPTDRWDAGVEDGHISSVCAELSDESVLEASLHSRYGMSYTYDLEAIEGDTVYVVIGAYRSHDTFGSRAGYFHILMVTRSYEKAMDLAGAAERSKDFELEHDGVTYYLPWTSSTEELQEVRVWDCYLRPRLD